MTKVSSEPKILSCFFVTNVLCSFRKSSDFRPMERCWSCPEFERFERGMDASDALEDKFVQLIQEHPERYDELMQEWEEVEKRLPE